MKFWCCRPRGEAFAHRFKPHGGIVVRTARPQRGAFAAFPMPGDGWARLELHSSSHSLSREIEAIVFTSENYDKIKVESTKEI